MGVSGGHGIIWAADGADADAFRIPRRLQIETIYGCNAACVMCALKDPHTRRAGPMPEDLFRKVVDEMAPYAASVEKVDLFGLGEPLLDKRLFDRIRYVRERGFRNIAISTNAQVLDAERRTRLLDTRIETVILSVDGTSKEVFEAIRVGLTFDRVEENTRAVIRLRDEGDYPTRFVVRFIRQQSNRHQWPAFKARWWPQLSPGKGDLLIAYDVNTMGGSYSSREELLGSRYDEEIERMPCHMVFDRLIVLNDGNVPLCCEDVPGASHSFGNAAQTPPIEIFNSESFRAVRRVHSAGNKRDMTMCRSCTMLYSEHDVEIVGG
jgi:sulfatase maturation enzyme AslB (radical SAM superfamily)